MNDSARTIKTPAQAAAPSTRVAVAGDDDALVTAWRAPPPRRPACALCARIAAGTRRARRSLHAGAPPAHEGGGERTWVGRTDSEGGSRRARVIAGAGPWARAAGARLAGHATSRQHVCRWRKMLKLPPQPACHMRGRLSPSTMITPLPSPSPQKTPNPKFQPGHPPSLPRLRAWRQSCRRPPGPPRKRGRPCTTIQRREGAQGEAMGRTPMGRWQQQG